MIMKNTNRFEELMNLDKETLVNVLLKSEQIRKGQGKILACVEEELSKYEDFAINGLLNSLKGYPEYIMEYLRQIRDLDKSDTSVDEDILAMSKTEVFDEVCDWNGLIKYGIVIRGWIADIWGIELDD